MKSIEQTIREIAAEHFPTFTYVFENWEDADTKLERLEYPAIVCVLPTGELSDEELDNVAGGCGGEEITEPKYKEGDLVWISGGFACHTCGLYRAFKVTEVHRSPVGKHTYSVACPECGEKWWNANVEEDSVDLLS